MSTPFASIETSINAASIAALANATMTWGVASSAVGVLKTEGAGLLGELVQGTAITFTGLTSDVGAIAYDTSVAIGATTYKVVRSEPDGAGFTKLTLQQAS